MSEEFKQSVKVSIGLLWGGAVGIVITTYTLTTIYWNFVALQEKVVYERNRSDRKFEQVLEKIDEMHEEITTTISNKQ